MFCPNCGTQNPDGSHFCRNCGGQLPVAAGPAARAGTGLAPNVAGLLCYVLGWVTGVIFLILEKDNEFVRFHAWQSIIVFGSVTVVQIALSILARIPFLGLLFTIVESLVGLAAFVLWIILMVKAYNGERYKMRWAGDRAEKYMNRRIA